MVTEKNWDDSRLIDDDEEQCCESPMIYMTPEGTIVCRNCGLEHGIQMIAQEKRAYTREEVRERKRSEPVWRSFGARTVIAVSRVDSKGNALTPRKRALFSKLSKIHGSLVSSIERNYWEAKPKLQRVSSLLGIPSHVEETAWKIYSESAKKKLTMGRSINAFVCASLYIATRVHNFPRLLDEFLDVIEVPVKIAHKCIGLVVREVLPDLNLKYRPFSARTLVYRFGNDLNLPVTIQQEAADMLKKAFENGMIGAGKDPKGMAAAALYLKSKSTHHRKTQYEIATVARITEVTLRTRAKQIQSYLGDHA